MKAVETPGGISILLSNDEYKIWESLCEEKCKADMTEREAYLAQSLTSRGVVKRTIREGKSYYSRIRGSL